MTYVELENGVSFRLGFNDPSGNPPLYQEDLDIQNLIPVDFGIGDTVCEVVMSDLWPSPGLLLCSRRFLINEIFLGFEVQETDITEVGDHYDLADVITFWGREPIDEGKVFSL